jgi:glutamate---cysteine ligase / carboxylate-amine ligase
MEHAFGTSEPFTLGIEEELLLVDRETRRLAPVAAEVLAAMDAPERAASHEVYAASIELRSPPRLDAEDAARELATLRAAARNAGATLIGAGVHPAGELGDVPLIDKPRYRLVGGAMRGLIRRTPECALHVHIGMPDPDTAIRVFNGIRSYLPLLLALSANSPLWFGQDSGLASARFALVRSYPRRAVPRAFEDLDDYGSTIAAVAEAGDLSDYTYVWWDVRLHPRLGTIELRELDAQSRIADATAIGALVQALARHLAEDARAPEPSEAISESSFRASRDGVEATLLDDGALRPVRDIARRTLDEISPVARELGGEAALSGIERLLEESGGAGRQRDALADGGIEAVLEMLVEDTAQASEHPQ